MDAKRLKPSEREAFRLIEEMLDLMETRSLVELEMEHEGLRLRLKKAIASPGPQVVEYVVGSSQPAAPPPGVGRPEEQGRRIIIKSPMVGTFYRSSAPGAKPFVDLGQAVKAGDTVCIIEAMKLLNEIESDHDGVIKAVLVENGQPVEYGQPLFIIG